MLSTRPSKDDLFGDLDGHVAIRDRRRVDPPELVLIGHIGETGREALGLGWKALLLAKASAGPFQARNEWASA